MAVEPPSLGPFAISKLVRSTFVTAMREAFKTDTDFPFIELPDGRTDIDQSVIDITDVEPAEVTKFPAIIVRSLIDRGGSIYFDDDFLGEIRDENGKLTGWEKGNQLRLTVELEVWAWDSIVREELTDKAYIFLKTVKDVYSTNGIELRHVTLITPREEDIGTRVHFISGLSVDTYSEWTFVEDVPENELISTFKVGVQRALITP